MGSTARERTRPLVVRPGTAYACHGDGLCCTDVHVLGPLGRGDARRLRSISPDVLRRSEDAGGLALRTTGDGACVFLGRGRCELHAALGPEAKPSFCRRFPLFLTATPEGGRVGVSHRCPCRTLGDRPPLTPEAAAPSLLDRGGRLVADHRLTGPVPVGPTRLAAFEDWRAYEAALLARLDAGEAPEAVLGKVPFPRFRTGRRWARVVAELDRDAARDGTRFGAAMAWFAAGIRAARWGRGAPPADRRPWAAAFDRAEARAGTPRDPEALFAEFAGDVIWSIAWAADGTFARCRQDLCTRLAVARGIARALLALGARGDRAAAEALAVVELVGASEWWGELLDDL